MMLLVIDDEAAVREAVAEALETIDVEVLMAANGPEGIELFQQHQANIDMVLLDMTMPVMSGKETFQALQAIAPDITVIFSSGYSEQETWRHFQGQAVGSFLRKPYNLGTLINTVQRLGDAIK